MDTRITLPFIALSTLLLSACATRSDTLPEECNLPAGVTVTSMELDTSQAGDIAATGETGFSVTVELSRELEGDEIAIVCYAVRDAEVVRGAPIAAGFVGIRSVDDDGIASRDNSFNLACDNGEVAGRAATSAFGMDDFDRSTGERSTRIFVQHLEGIRNFAGMEVGIQGETSNRIRVSCPG